MIFVMMWTVFSAAFFAGIAHSYAKVVLNAAVPSASLLIALLN